MRVVLDTNVFVSMALRGRVGEIYTAWKAEKFKLIISQAIFSEYLDVLQRPKLHLDAESVSTLVAYLQRKAEFVSPGETIQAIEADPSDNKFLEAALAGKAVYIVSGDHHLLELHSFRGVEIISAQEFISHLK